jgi:hypothetical protein
MSKDMKRAMEDAIKDKKLPVKKVGGLPSVVLGSSRLAKIEDAEEFTSELSQWMAARIGEMREWISRVANFLKLDWSKLQPIFDHVKADATALVEFVNNDEIPEGVRHNLARGAFGAALELYPRTPIGLEFLSRLGVETGYLRSVGKGVSLPIRTEEGRPGWEQMLPPHGHDTETSALIEFTKEVQANRNARHDERVAVLRSEGNMRFTEAIEKGGKSLVRINSTFGWMIGAVLVEG